MIFHAFLSPFFVIKKTKNLHKVILASSFIGRDVTLSDGCCFHDKAILFGKISVGRYTSINGPGTRIFGAKYGVNIGSLLIASNVIIQEHNHNMKTVSTCDVVGHVLGIKNDNIAVSKGEIVIEDDVWIGIEFCYLIRGKNWPKVLLLVTGLIVTKNVPKYAIVAGNPAKVIKIKYLMTKKYQN